ncbi:MAG TPA: metallophosphoesterase [Propionibacteriaceae bacterium]|nr:metallophosphoesterase [Propionibacteriaceae bacterium]
MKILAISDQVDQRIYSPAVADRFGDVDLVLSCGDLPLYYLEYVVTLLRVPLLYVNGNHTPEVETSYSGEEKREPGGCESVDERVVRVNGLAVGGLEGSLRYTPQGRYQYTEWQMRRKMWRMAPRLWLNRLVQGRYLNILITHAPPYGIHDGEDLCHTGFKSFLHFMRRYRPRYLIHGHIHLYNPNDRRVTQYGSTTVVNAYGFQVLEIDPYNPRTILAIEK